MTITECLHTQSRCYTVYQECEPVGIVVHSTGVNQTSVARYCQPSDNDPSRAEIISKIGRNRYGNHWNRPNVNKAVHYTSSASGGDMRVGRGERQERLLQLSSVSAHTV